MKLRYSLVMFMALQVCTAGATNYNNVDSDLSGQSLFSMGAPKNTSSSIVKDGWFRVQKNAKLEVMEPVGDAVQANVNIPTNGVLDIGQGTEVNVMEVSSDGRFVLIGIDEDGFATDNEGVNPNNVTLAWVRIEELHQAQLAQVDSELIEQLGLNPTFSKNEFADTEVASRRGGGAHRRGGGGRRGHGGMTYCLRDVRLTAARYTSHVPQGIVMASQAYGPYKAAGWEPTSYSPSNPIGTACFFSGGRSCGHGRGCGHAAIKISSNAWKGAGVRPTPFISGRPLIGCLTPPGR